MKVRLLIVLCLLVLLSLVRANEAPTGKVLFHEDWGYRDARQQALKLGTGPTKGLWYDCFKDNDAWVLAAGQTRKTNQGLTVLPAAIPLTKLWDVDYMKCPPGKSNASLWLPFGKHGLNRVRHDFTTPLPTSGAVECEIWAPGVKNLHERGVTVVLQTSQGEATIAFGLWAGTASPSYRVTGIRKGVPGHDDIRYHKLPEITISDPNVAGKADTWHDFVIDIGKTKPGELTFEYRTQGASATPSQKMAKPLALVQGKDYTAIKAIIIGSLPSALYAGTNELGDNAFFVGDVSFAGFRGGAASESSAVASNAIDATQIDQEQAAHEAFLLMTEMGDDFFSLCRQFGVSGADIPVQDLPAPIIEDLEFMLELDHARYGDMVDVSDSLQGTATIDLKPDGSSSTLQVISRIGRQREMWFRHAAPTFRTPPPE